MNTRARTMLRPPCSGQALPRVRRLRRRLRVVVLAVLALGLLGGTAHAVTSAYGAGRGRVHAPALAPTERPTATPSPSPAPSPSASQTGAQASPTPSPSGSAPASPPAQVTGGGETGSEREPCSMFDLGCKAREAVTDWFRELVETASEPTFKLLGSTVLATPEMDSAEMSRARQLWGVSQTIANTCFVLLVTLAGVLLMAGTSLGGEVGIKDLLPRVVAAFLVTNLSLTLIGYGIGFANGLAGAFLDAGGKRIDPGQAADVLASGVEASVNTGGVFLILLALVVVVLAVCVAFVYVVRLAVTMVLIAAAPVALMFHALPQTEGAAVLWWRAITGLLAIQVCQSLVFVTALELLFAQDAPAGKGSGPFIGLPTTKRDVIDLLMMICLLWILLRIPHWVSRAIWRQGRTRATRQIVSTYFAFKAMHRMFDRTHHRSRRTRNSNRRNNRTGGNAGGGNAGGDGGRNSNAGGSGGGNSGSGGRGGNTGGGRHGGSAGGGSGSAGGGQGSAGGGRGSADGNAGGSGGGSRSRSGSSHGGGNRRDGGGNRDEQQRRQNWQRYQRNRDRYRHQGRESHRPPDPRPNQRRHRNR